MNFELSTLWWVLAVALLIAELLTGTLYLLVWSVACAAAALAGNLQIGLQGQLAIAAVVGGVATATLYLRQARRRLGEARPAANPDVNLDVGEIVQVLAWDASGLTQVQHRGANWQARLLVGQPAQTGAHRIQAVEGIHLVLVPLQAANPMSNDR
jgi:membrane protein implicated in regulation of membrane protease activity